MEISLRDAKGKTTRSSGLPGRAYADEDVGEQRC
jgi:hypothetical protein